MPYSTSQGFITAARNPQIRPEVRVTLNDGLAIDSFILDQSKLDDSTTPFSRVASVTGDLVNASSFSLSAFEGDPLQADNFSIDIQNINKKYDYIALNRAVVGLPVKVEVGLDVSGTTEYIERVKGYIDATETYATDRVMLRISAVNKAKRALERIIGNAASPVIYAAQNPANIAFDLLTTRAGLDATTSSANIDIDYDSFIQYREICSSRSFSLAARFDGTSVAEALRLVGDITNGVIFARTDGKFVFSIYVPSFSPEEDINICSGNCDRPSLITNKDRLMNRIRVRYGYNPSTQTFAGSIEAEDLFSQSVYGLIGREIESTTVWHDTLDSARNFANIKVYARREPSQLFSMIAKLGTGGIRLLPGDTIKLTWDAVPLGKEFRVYSISGNISKSEYEVVAEDMDRERDFFILSDANNGILDRNRLF